MTGERIPHRKAWQYGTEKTELRRRRMEIGEGFWVTPGGDAEIQQAAEICADPQQGWFADLGCGGRVQLDDRRDERIPFLTGSLATRTSSSYCCAVLMET